MDGKGDPRMDQVLLMLIQLYEIIPDIDFRYGHQHHIPCNAPIVPPVERHRRECALLTAVVHPDDKEVVTPFQGSGDFHLKRRESPLMRHDPLPVEIDTATVAHATEIQEPAFTSLRKSLKVTGIPYRALIILQPGILRVPVTGHIQVEGTLEGIFITPRCPRRFPVFKNTPRLPLVIPVYDRRLFPIQRAAVTAIHIGHCLRRDG